MKEKENKDLGLSGKSGHVGLAGAPHLLTRKEIVDYFTKDRKWYVHKGDAPYWMYSFSESKDFDNGYVATLWCSNIPALMELRLSGEEMTFNGHVYSIEDIKRVFYLTIDSFNNTGNGRAENECVMKD